MNDEDTIVWIQLAIVMVIFDDVCFWSSHEPIPQPRSPVFIPLSNTTFFHNRQLNSQSLKAGVTKTPWPNHHHICPHRVGTLAMIRDSNRRQNASRVGDVPFTSKGYMHSSCRSVTSPRLNCRVFLCSVSGKLHSGWASAMPPRVSAGMSRTNSNGCL